nr:putative ribonuclease H-like domain-containing protein [Tanacetum cinerariifolium]
MDLFGPTFVSSLMHKKYGLAVTDDYSKHTWVFFLTAKDETTCILKKFIIDIENLVDKKVKNRVLVVKPHNKTLYELFRCRMPLFPSMLVIQEEEGKGSRHPSEPQPPPSTAQHTNEEPIPDVASSSHQKTQTPRQALNK